MKSTLLLAPSILIAVFVLSVFVQSKELTDTSPITPVKNVTNVKDVPQNIESKDNTTEISEPLSNPSSLPPNTTTDDSSNNTNILILTTFRPAQNNVTEIPVASTKAQPIMESSSTSTTAIVTTVISPSTTVTPPTVMPCHRFDGSSFMGGIVLTLGLLAISMVAYKFYKAHNERNYQTL